MERERESVSDISPLEMERERERMSPSEDDKWFELLSRKFFSESTCHWDAFMMHTSNQMSQMLLLLPSCVAHLGWWRATLATVISALISSWTAHLVQFFYFRCYRKPDEEEIIQICLLSSIVYFVNDKIEKRVWTILLASCCLLFAFFPDFRKSRVFTCLSFVTATVAALCIIVASRLHGAQVQGVKHLDQSHSISSFAWVCSIIVYAFGDTSAALDTLVIIRERNKKKLFKYAFCASTVYTTLLGLLAALSSYWSFGDELEKISPAAQPCTLAVLPRSLLRYVSSILLLILEIVAIGHSLYPVFMRLEHLPPCRKEHCYCILYRVACASIVGVICFLAVAIPFSGSMEITALIGSLVVSLAIYIIPTAAYMLYLASWHRKDVGLSSVSRITSNMINLTVFVGVLVIVVVFGGKTSIKKVFLSHHFGHSDFWNKCYLCSYLQRLPALAPIKAPAPTHSFANNISIMSNVTFL